MVAVEVRIPADYVSTGWGTPTVCARHGEPAVAHKRVKFPPAPAAPPQPLPVAAVDPQPTPAAPLDALSTPTAEPPRTTSPAGLADLLVARTKRLFRGC